MNKILAPIDFSPVSDAVIEHAVKLCKAFNAELVLMYVSQPQPGFKGCNYEKGMRWREVGLAEPASAIVTYADKADAAGAMVSIVVQQGPVVESILEVARQIEAAWIVLGSHGHGALYDLLVGSTAEGVVSVSTVPTIVVPGPKSQSS